MQGFWGFGSTYLRRDSSPIKRPSPNATPKVTPML